MQNHPITEWMELHIRKLTNTSYLGRRQSRTSTERCGQTWMLDKSVLLQTVEPRGQTSKSPRRRRVQYPKRFTGLLFFIPSSFVWSPALVVVLRLLGSIFLNHKGALMANFHSASSILPLDVGAGMVFLGPVRFFYTMPFIVSRSTTVGDGIREHRGIEAQVTSKRRNQLGSTPWQLGLDLVLLVLLSPANLRGSLSPFACKRFHRLLP